MREYNCFFSIFEPQTGVSLPLSQVTALYHTGCLGPRPRTMNVESNTDVWSFRHAARYTGYEDLEDGYDLIPLPVALDPEAGEKTYAKNATGAGTTVFGKPSTHMEETNKIYAGTEPGPLRN